MTGTMQDKVRLITGAARGMGRVTALALADVRRLATCHLYRKRLWDWTATVTGVGA
jgi:NAD(P)-dependent dehydrogenase (short-subunit alcohol dehydrogenase family)